MGRRGLGVGAVVLCLALVVFSRGRLLTSSPIAKAILDTVFGAVSLATAALFVTRFRQDQDPRHFWCACGFAVVAASSLLLAFARSIDATAGIYLVGFAFTTRLAGMAAVAVAAFLPRRDRLGRSRSLLLTSLLVVAGVVLFWGEVSFAAVQADLTIFLALPPAAVWSVWLAQVLMIAALAAGALAWRRSGRTDDDPLALWLGVALGLFLLARFNVLLYPADRSEWFHVGELYRSLAHVAVLVALYRSVAARWRTMVVEAARVERRRVAGDLHDGLAQDLALLSSCSRWLAPRSAEHSTDLTFVADVAGRALDESRRTMRALLHEGETLASPQMGTEQPPDLSLEMVHARPPLPSWVSVWSTKIPNR